jgi:hypothetical protein
VKKTSKFNDLLPFSILSYITMRDKLLFVFLLVVAAASSHAQGKNSMRPICKK